MNFRGLSVITAGLVMMVILGACGDSKQFSDFKIMMGSSETEGYLNISKSKSGGGIHLEFRGDDGNGGTDLREADLASEDSQMITELLKTAKLCAYNETTQYLGDYDPDYHMYVVTKLTDKKTKKGADLVPLRKSPRSYYICGSRADEIALLPYILLLALDKKSIGHR